MNIENTALIEKITLSDQLDRANQMLNKYQLENSVIRKNDFPNRVYVSSSLEIFEQLAYWEKEVKRITEKIEKIKRY